MSPLETDPFWFDMPEILFSQTRLVEFFPTKEQSMNERFNSLMRLAIYVSVLLFMYHKDSRFLYIIAAMGLITYYLTQAKDHTEGKTATNGASRESFEEPDGDPNQQCTRPTLGNPFMNVTMADYMNIKDGKIVDRPPACDSQDPEIKKASDELFSNNLYRDVNDIFGKMNSQRQFFTMPYTQIPNRQDEFAKWLYSSPATCKENQDYCLKYEDVRAKSSAGLLINPNKNPTRVN